LAYGKKQEAFVWLVERHNKWTVCSMISSAQFIGPVLMNVGHVHHGMLNPVRESGPIRAMGSLLS